MDLASERLLQCACEIARAAVSSSSLADLGRRIVDALNHLVPIQNAFLALLHPEEDVLSFPFWLDERDPYPSIKRLEDGLTEYVLRRGEPFYASAAQFLIGERAGHFRIRGARPVEWCGFPLFQGTRAFGVFAVQSYDGDPLIGEEGFRLLHKLSDAIGCAVLVLRTSEERNRREALLNAAADAAELFLKDIVWTNSIQRVLEKFGRAAEASRTYLFRVHTNDAGRILTSHLFEWCAEGIIPQIDNPDLQNLDFEAAGFPRWIEHLRQGNPISGPVRLMPFSEWDVLKSQGILSLHVSPIHVEGQWWGFIGFDDCVTERVWLSAEKQALRLCAQVLGQAIERERVEGQFHLQRTALSMAANGIVVTDAEGRIVWVNDAFTRITGYTAEEALGRKPSILKSGRHSPEFYRRLWETISAGRVWEGEIVNRRKNGNLYTQETTITPVRDAAGRITHYVAITQDITERIQLREQLAHAQKMESIGRLAGGIAHDFNNLLQAIVGFGEILLTELAEADPRRHEVLEILDASKKASLLTRQLLTFSRRQPIEKKIVEISSVIRAVEKLLERLFPENIAIELAVEEDLPPVSGNAAQLEQALLNLALNARDAMPEGGNLKIVARLVELNSGNLPPAEGARPGRFVELSVSDDGVGMEPEVLDHIFEPFFTTKEPGSGTGLGLPVVLGIVRQHDGFIDVTSAKDRGTTVRLFLPPASVVGEEEKQTASPAAAPSMTTRQSLYGAGEHVLVVEDEPSVRDLIVRILTNHNYRVTAVGTAGEARRLLKEEQTSYAALMTDIVLPDGNGLSLAEEARRAHPHLRAILTSGYPQESERFEKRIEAMQGFLAKPFAPAILLETLRSALTNPV